MTSARFRAPKGTQDILPPESVRWEALLATFASTVKRADFGLLQSPMFEDRALFRDTEGADAVRKEMYELTDKAGNELALRPEGTASAVRAFIEHQPLAPWKVWYATPAFRYENVQAGRFRQHHQVGIEAIGAADPDLDVEIIAVASEFLAALGLVCDLQINTMGTPDDRAAYVAVLQRYLRSRLAELAPDDQERVARHPMRVLDSKAKSTRAVVVNAPKITDHLSPESEAHYDRVLDGLDRLGIAYTVSPRLVRGFDYYTHTTFEFVPAYVGNAQSTVLGGGRYDGLVGELGGQPTPGIGFAAGIERLLIACDAQAVFDAPADRLDVFVVDVTGGGVALDITTELRAAGLCCDRTYGDKSMRAQMKAADRSGAACAVIVGPSELLDETVSLRLLRDGYGAGSQPVVPQADLVPELRRLLRLG
jgi:histidyl-tRNA synthetase